MWSPKPSVFVKERVVEETCRVVTPFLAEAVAYVADCPGDDDGVVEGDEECDKYLEPAGEFTPFADTAEGQRPGSTVAVS
ncbi:MAG: hypothetical protein U1U88_000520 [Lawsonella clevelandensis]